MRGYVWGVVVLLAVASAWAMTQDEAQAQYASCSGAYGAQAQPVRRVARGVVRLLGFERRQARREARRAARASYSCFGSPVNSVGCGG